VAVLLAQEGLLVETGQRAAAVVVAHEYSKSLPLQP
jgi:hypothetical protein